MTKVLLVDDYDETLESLSLLYGLFSDVEIVGLAHNSEELWCDLSTKNVDMISLDIQLGIENGLELCQRIHDKYPHIFIVMCSLEASERNKHIASQAGASHFLAKPISKHDLSETLRIFKTPRKSAPETVSKSEEDWIDDLLSLL